MEGAALAPDLWAQVLREEAKPERPQKEAPQTTRLTTELPAMTELLLMLLAATLTQTLTLALALGRAQLEPMFLLLARKLQKMLRQVSGRA